MERLSLIESQLTPLQSLSITDSRNAKKYHLPLKNSFLHASHLAKITFQSKPLRLYDPAFKNTINCTSAISYIDEDKGILQYRGYPIEVLTQRGKFLEVAFLIIFGELPSPKEYLKFERRVLSHTFLHTDVGQIMKSFRYDAHPMGVICSTLVALSTVHPEQNPFLVGEDVYSNQQIRNKQIYRILGNLPTIAANAYRHRIGREYNKPAEGQGYVQNFLTMIDKLNETDYQSNPRIVRALEILFIIHAEHELNSSTAALRHLSSSGADVYTCIAGASATLYGCKNGGTSEEVLKMLQKIRKMGNIHQFIEDVKSRKEVLYGFGHSVYKNYDPRAKIVKNLADDVFEVTGKEDLIEIAVALEKIVLSDSYFTSKKLYPNVYFYSGIIYQAMGFPPDMFPVLLMIPRVAGWLGHWKEYLDDPERKPVRPYQCYRGERERNWVGIEKRRQRENIFLWSEEQGWKGRRR